MDWRRNPELPFWPIKQKIKSERRKESKSHKKEEIDTLDLKSLCWFSKLAVDKRSENGSRL
jgi:hypothetical protein